ncbi:hypothetical protein [Vibrio parahaemolyticus]|uniref:hypothetical protein n=1 Tax=Vibrio parahaemolyticus TaxID=670 RepID=UPI003D81688B
MDKTITNINEITQETDERFERGEGIVQLDPDWPDDFLIKIIRKSLKRSNGSKITITPIPSEHNSLQIPWEQGYVAFHAGSPQDSNPHEQLSENAFFWNQGWECGEGEKVAEGLVKSPETSED